MNNAYEKIKAILSTGVHKVEVFFYQEGGSIGSTIIEDKNTAYSTRGLFDITSIKPIPIIPKPLEVGTKVDVSLREDGSSSFVGTITKYNNIGTYDIKTEFGTADFPAWAVVPHQSEDSTEYEHPINKAYKDLYYEKHHWEASQEQDDQNKEMNKFVDSRKLPSEWIAERVGKSMCGDYHPSRGDLKHCAHCGGRGTDSPLRYTREDAIIEYLDKFK